MAYDVIATPYGPDYLLRVPAFGLSKLHTGGKNTIDQAARSIIAGCSTAPRTFEIDLEVQAPAVRARRYVA
jgi:hypothetical protein